MAPTPVINPSLRPRCNVRRTQSTPTGPIGAETKTPIKKPSTIVVISHIIFFSEGELCLYKPSAMLYKGKQLTLNNAHLHNKRGE